MADENKNPEVAPVAAPAPTPKASKTKTPAAAIEDPRGNKAERGGFTFFIKE